MRGFAPAEHTKKPQGWFAQLARFHAESDRPEVATAKEYLFFARQDGEERQARAAHSACDIC